MSTVIQVESVFKKFRRGRTGFSDITERFLQFFKDNLQGAGNKGNNDFYALKDVTIGVNKGEIVGITGSNGAGKSTLLKLIYGVTAPSSGVIKIKGSMAGYLDIFSCFYHQFTGRENILLAGAYFGAKKESLTENMDRILEFAELQDFADTPIKKYSSGMFLRLAFSILVHLDHEILFFDEVFSVGDAVFQQKCQKTMENMIKSPKKTILLVSHNSELIKGVCSREIVLRNGEIISDKYL